MPELVLPVHDIDEAGKDFDFELSSAWLEQALQDTGLRRDPNKQEGHVHVHAQKNGVEILVNGMIDADLLVDCSRCLGDTPLPVHVPLTALLLPAGHGEETSHEVELEAEDLDRMSYEGHEVVLDELVREQLVLESPMQPLCRPDCAGIALPSTGVSAGPRVDPRLAKLRELKDRLSADSDDTLDKIKE